MSSVNKFIGIGNVTKDPETRYLPSGEAVTNLSIACNEKWKTKEGEDRESVEFINLIFFRKLAEVVGKYLTKGSLIYVEGKLQTRKWQDKEGKDRYTTEIVADKMKMLGGKQTGEQKPQAAKQDAGSFADFEDDIDF